MSKKFAVSRHVSVNGNPPIKITYRYDVVAETPEEACRFISGDWSVGWSNFKNYPQNLLPKDTIKFVGDYIAEEVSND